MLALKNNQLKCFNNVLRFYSSHVASTVPVTSKQKALFSELDKDELDPVTQTPDYVRLTLRSHVYDAIDETPITKGVNLSQKYNTNVFLKREDLQPVFSFKVRGAYNMISKLNEKYKGDISGVIACSAGNHAQGVALSSKLLNIPATIVMPVNTPSIKHSNVSRLGGRVVLFGQDFDECKKECSKMAEELKLINIPPFDHPYIIAGQATIAMEILRQVKRSNNIEAVFVPVGGGGLVAGVGAYLIRIARRLKIIAVETYDSPTLYNSLKAKKVVDLNTVGTFADGTAVKRIGTETFRICQEVVDEVVRVDTDELCAAMKDIFDDTRTIVEPSGALSVAGMKKYISQRSDESHASKTYVPILSGANMNFDRLRFVSERAVLGEGKEVFMLVTIPDIPGSFKKLQNVLHPRHVTEFSYRYNEHQQHHLKGSTALPKACIYTSFSCVKRDEDLKRVIQDLNKLGFQAIDISDNEMAKSHGRYLVGGAAKIPNERIISFNFPERPGALTKFLNGMNTNWNLTLFHYRNHGSDTGKVLVGVSVPPKENMAFQKFLDDLGYVYEDVSDNIVFQKFLRY